MIAARVESAAFGDGPEAAALRYEHIKVPPQGARIAVSVDGSFDVPDRRVIPFIEGDAIIRHMAD